MFGIGSKVMVGNLETFRWAEKHWRGKVGEVRDVDSFDGSYYVCFNDGSHIWFNADELIPMHQSFTSVGEAVDFLVSNGYRVTLEKLQ